VAVSLCLWLGWPALAKAEPGRRGQAVGWHRRATANTTTRSTAGSSSAGRGCRLRLRLRHSADCRAGPAAGRHCCC
jgi:hypothetical protein